MVKIILPTHGISKNCRNCEIFCFDIVILSPCGLNPFSSPYTPQAHSHAHSHTHTQPEMKPDLSQLLLVDRQSAGLARYTFTPKIPTNL